MKGAFEIKVTVKNDTGVFPMTEVITIGVDNTPECMTALADYFRRVALAMGFDQDVVKLIIRDEEQ